MLHVPPNEEEEGKLIDLQQSYRDVLIQHKIVVSNLMVLCTALTKMKKKYPEAYSYLMTPTLRKKLGLTDAIHEPLQSTHKSS